MAWLLISIVRISVVPSQPESVRRFPLAPEVQKLLKVVFSEPSRQFSADTLARMTKLNAGDVARTQEHLIKSGILNQHQAKNGEAEAISREHYVRLLQGTEEYRAQVVRCSRAHSRDAAFKVQVVGSARSSVLGEDKEAIVELLQYTASGPR